MLNAFDILKFHTAAAVCQENKEEADGELHLAITSLQPRDQTHTAFTGTCVFTALT